MFKADKYNQEFKMSKRNNIRLNLYFQKQEKQIKINKKIYKNNQDLMFWKKINCMLIYLILTNL